MGSYNILSIILFLSSKMAYDFPLKLMNLIDLLIFSNTKLGHVYSCRSKKEIESRTETIMSHIIHNCLVYNNSVLTQE